MMSSDKQRQKISFKFFLHKTTTKTFKPEQPWLRPYSMLALKYCSVTISKLVKKYFKKVLILDLIKFILYQEIHSIF